MISARQARIAGALLGFLWFLQIGGWPTLNPTHYTWLLDGDWTQHWLGWLMFRNEPWTLPVGTLSKSLYPIGTSIGFTDSNPLLSVLLKPFSPWLPMYFQFIGPWLALCFTLQGYMGVRLASVVTPEPEQQLLGGYLLILSPALLARLAHDTLCAHWILLAGLYLGLREYTAPSTVTKGLRYSALLVTLSACIHPYLTAMSWPLSMALYARLWRGGRVSLARAAMHAGAATAGALLVFSLFGYFGRAEIGGTGFGEYSSDALTFINSLGTSRLLPALPLRDIGQHEGFGFLGLGGLAVCAVGLAGLIRRPRVPWRTVAPVAVACVLMSIWALSSVITVGGVEVLQLEKLYKPFAGALTPFRSSGRFIWPLYYLALTFGLWGVVRATRLTRLARTVLLALAVALQATDASVRNGWAQPKQFREASFSNFVLARGQYQHIAIFPAQVLGACKTEPDPALVYRYMLLAYQLRMTFNSGIFARIPASQVNDECYRMSEAVRTGALDPDTIYIVAPFFLDEFKADEAGCGRFDGDWICVSRDSNVVFRTFVTTGRVIAAPIK